jgi:hypothetical protein
MAFADGVGAMAFADGDGFRFVAAVEGIRSARARVPGREVVESC